jgi:chemotaxis protein methyltransferase CheR
MDARLNNIEALRFWSAGCASGEEAYTLNLIWKQFFQIRFPALKLSIIGTDSDPHMLNRARRGVYPASSLKDFPVGSMDLAFENADGQFSLRPEFQDGVLFCRQDIRHEAPAGEFHLILCRNLVFTYFNEALQAEVLRKIYGKLVDGGMLVIGTHERLPTEVANLRPSCHGTGIYRKLK